MTNTYEQEIYNFLTQSENYRACKQISGYIGQVEETLKSNFWKLVVEKLRKSIVDPDWIIDYSFPNWLSIHRKGWTELGINCDQLSSTPDLGIHAPRESFDRSTVDSFLSHVRTTEGKGKSTDAWPYFYPLGYNFYQQNTLENILPEYVAATTEEVATSILNFFNKYSHILDQIMNKAKLPLTSPS